MKTKKEMLNKLVLITWFDAFHQDGCRWTSKDELEEFIKDNEFLCKNVGWVIHQDKSMITVSSQITSKGEQASHIQRIPIGCIKNIKILKP